MCFSAQADIVGGLAVGVIGVDVVRHVGHRRQAALACLPLLLAAHQLDEAFVWFGLQGHVPWDVGRIALWIYLLFAFVVLPVFVPMAVMALEPPGARRRVMAGFAVAGAVVSTVLLVTMLRGPVTAKLAHYHLRYAIGLNAGVFIVAAYVLVVCGALLFSGHRDIAVFGLVNLVMVAVLARLAVDGFASLWCGWAAITSGALALHLRIGSPHRGRAPDPGIVPAGG